MNELLTRVLEAHGGLEKWASVRRIRAEVSLGGPFWGWRGQTGIERKQTITLDARREHVELTPFTGDRLTSVFDVDPVRVAIRDATGQVVAARENPLATFPVYADTVAWDELQVAYFTGTANWNYFTEPFLFTYPGVGVREVEPWHEDGETWRRLAVTFPPELPNHNPEQTFYYDANFLLRRMDYSPEITGHSRIAHYVHEPRVFDGFVFYARRLVHVRDEAGVANQNFSVITIDTHAVSVEHD